MAIVTGPALDAIAKDLAAWYIDTREKLIQGLEEGYPYGSVPLSPSEQIDRFLSMTPEDWEALTAKLTDRHRGKPNAEALVRKDLEEFVAKMNRMTSSRRTV
ncbi:hypothetical protein LCGC14_1075270 [marine sediment metagenome]|uniref:Uncharacterized protein n=1 Tax=marine sediment metagenome TaxID=412755 RepID=A0A0F9QMR9_9ZZZZ